VGVLRKVGPADDGLTFVGVCLKESRRGNDSGLVAGGAPCRLLAFEHAIPLAGLAFASRSSVLSS
jgi:hypothetical protein